MTWLWHFCRRYLILNVKNEQSLHSLAILLDLNVHFNGYNCNVEVVMGKSHLTTSIINTVDIQQDTII